MKHEATEASQVRGGRGRRLPVRDPVRMGHVPSDTEGATEEGMITQRYRLREC